MPTSRIALPSALLAAALLGSTACAQQYTATVFPPEFVFEIFVHGAANGRQVGSYSSEANGFATHAALWMGSATLIDLHPAGADSSVAHGCGGLQQVGVADFEGQTVAMLWTGSAGSAVSLNPEGFGYSSATGTDGVTQVGSGRGPGTGRGPHALAWTGTAASVVDIHPSDYTFSIASAVDGQRIAGSATDTFSMWNAGYWTARDGASWVPLHPLEGFDETRATSVSGTSVGGYGRGPATNNATHGLVWFNDGQTMVDLHPGWFEESYVHAVRGNLQAGSVLLPFGSIDEHAAVWSGSAESFIDLHDAITEGGWNGSVVTGIDTDGNLYGYVVNGTVSAPVRWTPASTNCGPADVGSSGGVPGPDGVLDNNDFIAFIDMFFGQASGADIGAAGGVFGSDGAFDNNDFIAFIDLFFAGC